jgi:hypothetical protein
VRIDAHEKGPVDSLLPAMQANRLGDGKDVSLVERPLKRGAAMPRGAERHPLRLDGRIGRLRVIGGNQSWDIDQQRWVGRLSGKRTEFHACPMGP